MGTEKEDPKGYSTEEDKYHYIIDNFSYWFSRHHNYSRFKNVDEVSVLEFYYTCCLYVFKSC